MLGWVVGSGGGHASATRACVSTHMCACVGWQRRCGAGRLPSFPCLPLCLCASVPLSSSICASVPLCLCVTVPLCLCLHKHLCLCASVSSNICASVPLCHCVSKHLCLCALCAPPPLPAVRPAAPAGPDRVPLPQPTLHAGGVGAAAARNGAPRVYQSEQVCVSCVCVCVCVCV